MKGGGLSPGKPKQSGSVRRVSNAHRTTKPKLAYCHHCKRHVLSATYDALPRTFDPVPLTMEGELACLLRGEATWFIAGGHLYKRNSWAIKTSPRGLGGMIVQPHHCDHPQPSGSHANWPQPKSDDPGF
jgi:hypothetical protein